LREYFAFSKELDMALELPLVEALRLTRAGKLGEATALLRNGLGAAVQMPTKTVREVIDLVAQQPRPETRDSRRSHSPDRDAANVGQGPAQPGARFEARHHIGKAGSIAYMLYRPTNVVSGMPLVVMLHGCTQTPEDFAKGTGMNALAEEMGFLVAYPRQTQAANAQKCWNWFRPGDQKRDAGEPSLIAGLTRDVIASEQVDSSRVYVAGLSAGGAAAAIMADAYPDLFAAVGVHSGLACGAAKDMAGAFAAMQQGAGASIRPSKPGSRFVPVITFHGDSDRTVSEANARGIVAAATAAAGRPVMVESEMGNVAGRRFIRALSKDASGEVLIEQWTVAGAGHAWSGGDTSGSYTDASGPDASREMLRFFLTHRSPAQAA
jgi:poly(hydroxyalkanoate) depolymerase family esterase